MTEERMDRLIGGVLRVGVIAAAAVAVAGGAWYLAQSGEQIPKYHVFHGEPAELSSLRGAVSGIAQGNAASLIQFGLLLLIATPVARVAFSVVAFALQRDWRFVAITLIVLAVLTASLAGVQL